MIGNKQLDAFATNKPILFEMSDGIPGSRILDGRWGVEHVAVANPQRPRNRARLYPAICRRRPAERTLGGSRITLRSQRFNQSGLARFVRFGLLADITPLDLNDGPCSAVAIDEPSRTSRVYNSTDVETAHSRMVSRTTRWQWPGRATEIVPPALDSTLGACRCWRRSTLLGWRRLRCAYRFGIRLKATF